jgi:polyhydroxyalkanoate synthesis regulator protein
MMENMAKANPMARMPGFEAMQAQQEAFFKAMTGGMMGAKAPATDEAGKGDDLDDIKKELAALQEKLSRMSR